MRLPAAAASALLAALGAAGGRAAAAEQTGGAKPAAEDDKGSFAIARASGEIRVDGELGDAGWKSATRVETWFETNPGDNLPPKVGNLAFLAYDDHAFYAGFSFEDPDPRAIRAPLGDRDNVPGYTDYGGIILDTRNDRRTGILLLANPRGVQYDAVTDDTTGNEDSSLDLFWDSAARINDHGWTLEIRVPFSSLRYARGDPQTWGVLLYRNRPRDFRYQMFSSRLPRGSNCFICRSAALTGLSGLPTGGHFVIAPYVTAEHGASAVDGAGSRLSEGDTDGQGGVDVKWIANAENAFDLTVNPDFSQIESDVARIGVNERFALFYPERRPFFLEGLELFATPIQAVYTRSFTSPRWGGRGTGKVGGTAYTVLAGEDEGGGSVIIPGSNSSDFADQEFRSHVAIARVRRDLGRGRSYVSGLMTDREVDGGGHNRVYGPDFQWHPDEHVTVTGQLLWSDTETPVRPDLAAEWDGRRLQGHAGDLWASRNTTHLDLYGEYKDLADEFRADDGFVPQVGYRQGYGEAGWTFRPQGFLNRLRTFVIVDRSDDRQGALLNREVSAGAGMNGRFNSFGRFRYSDDQARSGDRTLPRRRLFYTVTLDPTRGLSGIEIDGNVGEQIDFENDRPGRGASVALAATLRPTDHLELRLNGDRSWVDVRGGSGSEEGGDYRRLFTATVSRLRATYAFSARSFVRGIGQWVETRRDPALYLDSAIDSREGSFSGSLLFAYKLNWQSVLFVGYGDNRALDDVDNLGKLDHQFFVKLSYAWQR